MKKLLYLAVMALTVAVMTACGGVALTDSKYAIGEGPQIDTEKATVNGVHYNNEDEMCWKLTEVAKAGSTKVTSYQYVWGTEFDMRVAGEEFIASMNWIGQSAGYSYIVTTDEDSQACLKHNDKN